MSAFKIITKRYIVTALLVFVISIAIISSTPSDLIAQFTDDAKNLVLQYGIWAPLLYVLIFTVIALTGFSITALSIVAIGVFDTLAAFFIILVGAFSSASIAFLLSRSSRYHILPTQRRSAKRKNIVASIASNIAMSVANHPLRSVFIFQLTSIPYITFSYAAGMLSSLSYVKFAIATAGSNTILAFLYVVVGITLLPYVSLVAILLLASHGVYLTWQYTMRR